MNTEDNAYKFGCGRYIQGQGVLACCGEELQRLHSKKPVIIGGPTALGVALDGLTDSLEKAGLDYGVRRYSGYCCMSYVEECCAYMADEGCDAVIGVGGGRILDLAKAVAEQMGRPVVNVPTSAATCAACTPLSVMYTEEGKTIQGSWKHKREVDVVLADLDVLLTQPPRLLIAGAYDSLAKYIETTQRIRGKREEDMLLGIDYAYLLSRQTYADIRRLLPEALDSLQRGVVTYAFEKIVYINLAVTGVISGIARGFGQTAFAHEFYEAVRTVFTEEAATFIHGELVGMALAVQLAYNGEEAQIPELREMLFAYGLPVKLQDVHIPPTAESIRRLVEDMRESRSMKEAGAEGEPRLLKAMQQLL